jgi:hypothetical protein
MLQERTTILISVALIVGVFAAVHVNRVAVRAHCDLRKRILANTGTVSIVFDADMRMTEFEVSPTLVGLSYMSNEQVQRIFSRARTGGGFCKFTFRDTHTDDGGLVTYLFFCESKDATGTVVGRGARLR